MATQGEGFVFYPSPRSNFWPVVLMSDGTLRKGPKAEIVGRRN